ncbi:MAG: sigma 54-interacting transcriptional regulator, partial [Polyangiaceae bacterium]
LDLGRDLERSLDLRHALGPIMDKITRQLDWRRGALCISPREHGQANAQDTLEISSGLAPLQQGKNTWHFGKTVTGEVIRTGQALLIPHISRDRRFLRSRTTRLGPPGHDLAVLCVPLRLDAQTIGALCAARITRDRPTLEHVLRLMTSIASMITDSVRLRREARVEAIQLKKENQRLQGQLENRFRPANMVGNSKATRRACELIKEVAPTNTHVILLGERGTGKELAAHAIHFGGPRATKPFVAFNCAGLPTAMVERELFGYESGAVAGADTPRVGRIEMADGGTLFLDNIHELPESIQGKLLELLREQSVQRLGGDCPRHVDVRVIVSTNRDLEGQVKAGRFRKELHRRLSVFPIVLLPLRQRRSDILPLANFLVRQYGELYGKNVKRIATSAMDMLLSYGWPGNARELEQYIEGAVQQSSDEVLHGHHFPPSIQTAQASGTELRGTLTDKLAAVESEIITDALKSSRGNVARAARELGVTERVMGLRVRRYAIDPKRFKLSHIRQRPMGSSRLG